MLTQGGSTDTLVDVRELSVRLPGAGIGRHAVDRVSFSVRAGETLCLVGESGSGKTLTMRALMRLVPTAAQIGGEIRIVGQDMLALNGRELAAARGRLVSMVFQEPLTSLDPVFTIGQQIVETLVAHDPSCRAGARQRALELLELVQVPLAERRLDAYPHELSGGLRQRAMIALALSCRPRVLLADEPTTALDASVQVQILLLLRRLQREFGMATIFVTHDLGVACEVADRVAVMYAGRFVETGTVREVLRAPGHPYTKGLLGATLQSRRSAGRLQPITGSPPDLAALPPGCSFAPRCPEAGERCSVEMPAMHGDAAGHAVRCLLAATEGRRDVG